MIEFRIYALGAVIIIPVAFRWALLGVACCLNLLAVWRKGWKEGGRYCAVIWMMAWVVLVIGSTVVFRESSEESRIQLIPFISYWDFGENSYFLECFVANLLNVMLFVPIGFLTGLGFRNVGWKKVALLGGLLSVAIEIVQFVFRKGYCEVDDVIHNVAGCLIGYGVYIISAVIFHPRVKLF